MSSISVVFPVDTNVKVRPTRAKMHMRMITARSGSSSDVSFASVVWRTALIVLLMTTVVRMPLYLQVLFKENDKCLEIVLNRPKALNALNLAMVRMIQDRYDVRFLTSISCRVPFYLKMLVLYRLHAIPPVHAHTYAVQLHMGVQNTTLVTCARLHLHSR